MTSWAFALSLQPHGTGAVPVGYEGTALYLVEGWGKNLSCVPCALDCCSSQERLLLLCMCVRECERGSAVK